MYRLVPLLVVRFSSFFRDVTSPKSPIFICFAFTKNMLLGCGKKGLYMYKLDRLLLHPPIILAKATFMFTCTPFIHPHTGIPKQEA
jgi:hypothetical protein